VSQSITISAGALMLAPPALMLVGGLIVGVAMHWYLQTGIEVARLNATNDDASARWLWQRGYRKTPHAGPDVTECKPLALSDRSHADEQADHTDTDRPRWWATVAAFVVLAPAAFLAGQFKALAAWWRRRRDERYLIGSGEQATDVDPFAELLAHVEAVEPEPVSIVRVNHRYRRPGDTGLFPLVKVVGDKAAGRHRAEPEMPAINATVPAQREAAK
jgi:hypothetical protein